MVVGDVVFVNVVVVDDAKRHVHRQIRISREIYEDMNSGISHGGIESADTDRGTHTERDLVCTTYKSSHLHPISSRLIVSF